MSFNGERLNLARRRRGLTIVELAGQVGLARETISRLESGSEMPSAETLMRLASTLEFETTFFELSSPHWMATEGASFRALSSMSARQRHRVLAAGAIALELAAWIESRFRLPACDVPDLRGMTPEEAATALRARWRIGAEKPIANLIHLLESHGIRVFSLAEDCIEVDAFSLWHEGTPFVFLNTRKSSERSRMDAAHELGHLVMHRHGPPQGPEIEEEAQGFAGAFLLPGAALMTEAPRVPTTSRLLALKRRWRVSAVACAVRLYRMRLVTEWQYRELMIEISKLGWRTNEPEGLPRETSQVLDKVLRALRAEGTSRQDIARALHLRPRDLEELVFGLVLSGVSDQHEWSSEPFKPSTEPAQLRLRLVT